MPVAAPATPAARPRPASVIRGGNTEFTQTLARRRLGRVRPCVPAPAWVLRLALGEMSVLLLGGQRLAPRRTQGQGLPGAIPSWQRPGAAAAKIIVKIVAYGALILGSKPVASACNNGSAPHQGLASGFSNCPRNAVLSGSTVLG